MHEALSMNPVSDSTVPSPDSAISLPRTSTLLTTHHPTTSPLWFSQRKIHSTQLIYQTMNEILWRVAFLSKTNLQLKFRLTGNNSGDYRDGVGEVITPQSRMIIQLRYVSSVPINQVLGDLFSCKYSTYKTILQSTVCTVHGPYPTFQGAVIQPQQSMIRSVTNLPSSRISSYSTIWPSTCVLFDE
jgi:hypothetical protein